MMLIGPLLMALLICITTTKSAVSDLYTQLPGGFLPSPVKYFKQNGDLIAMESEAVPSNLGQGQDNSVTSTTERTQQPRIGYPLYSGTSLMGGYSSTSPGVVSPVKLDLGGLLLGTVVGLGAVLLIPKIVHIFSYHHPYSRNDEGLTAGLGELVGRVDEALTAQHVNSTVCLERAACSLGQSSLDSVTRNPLVSFLVEGSRMERALEAGRSGQSCGALYPQCAFDHHTLAAAFDVVTSSLQT